MKKSQIWTKSLSASRPCRVEYEDLPAHFGPYSGVRVDTGTVEGVLLTLMSDAVLYETRQGSPVGTDHICAYSTTK